MLHYLLSHRSNLAALLWLFQTFLVQVVMERWGIISFEKNHSIRAFWDHTVWSDLMFDNQHLRSVGRYGLDTLHTLFPPHDIKHLSHAHAHAFMQARRGPEQKSRINSQICLGIIGFCPPVRQNPPLLRPVHQVSGGILQILSRTWSGSYFTKNK